MVKKRVKEKSVKKKIQEKPISSKNKENKNTQVKSTGIKNKNWWQWLVLIVVIVLLIVLIISVTSKNKTKTVCEQNGFTCKDSCPLGYREKNYECKTEKVCCGKNSDQEVSPCEQYGYACFDGSCPGGFGQIDLGCSSGKTCCGNSSAAGTPCEKAGYPCFKSSLPEPSCPTGYAELDLGCSSGEACCKRYCVEEGKSGTGADGCCLGLKSVTGILPGVTVSPDKFWCVNCGNGVCDYYENWYECPQDCKKSIVYGFVTLKEGDCMPPIGANCTEKSIATHVGIFPKTQQAKMNGNYLFTTIGPSKMVLSEINGRALGYYEIELSPGEYSIFAQDAKNANNYYCNNFDSKGYACYFNISAPLRYDIVIDYSAQ